MLNLNGASIQVAELTTWAMANKGKDYTYGAIGKADTVQAAPRSVSLDDVLNYIGFGRFQVVIFVLAGLGNVSYGLEDLTFSFINMPIGKQWNLTSLQFAVLPAMTSVANIVGAVVFGSLTDLYGRVWPFSLCIAIVGVFTLASAFAPSFPVFCALRVIVSSGSGGIPTFIYPMLVEFLPVRKRGTVGSLVKLVQMTASCIGVGLAWWLVPTYKSWGWRYYLMALSAPSIFTAAFRIIFWVESPRFLVQKGDINGAWKVLKAVARVNGKDLTLFTSKEALQHYEKLKPQRATCKHAFSSFFQKYFSIFKRQYLLMSVTLLVIGVLVATGDYGTTLFLPNILKPLVSKRYLYFLPLAGLFARIPGVVLLSIIVEWPEVGRLRSLKFFSLSTAIFLLLSGLIRSPVATSVFLLLIFFNMEPLTPLLDLYISEVYPTEVRAVALSINNVAASFIQIGSPFIDGYIADEAPKLPWLFGVTTSVVYLVIFGFSFVLRKETRGSHLTDNVSKA